MHASETSVPTLNHVLVQSLTAINQHFLHARILKNWGYTVLAKVIYKESIAEMKHASAFTDRILLLEGLPHFQRLLPLKIGEGVDEILKAELSLSLDAVRGLRAAVATVKGVDDHGSADMLESVLVAKEDYLDWLESQQHMLDELGLALYLGRQVEA